MLVENFKMNELNVALANTGNTSVEMDMIGDIMFKNLPVAAKVSLLNMFNYILGKCNM